MIWLGLASNYSFKQTLTHTFCFASKSIYFKLTAALAQKYHSIPDQTVLTYSGRSAIALALQSFIQAGLLQPDDHVAINSFTCHAVLQAIKFAKLKPVFIDLAKNSPNFSESKLESVLKKDKKIKVLILQNTFGLPHNINKITSLQQKYNFLIIEDLAHCAGRFYANGQEMGTLGDATCLSFGKGKSIDTITGGALVLRKDHSLPSDFLIPSISPTKGQSFRARLYPIFGTTARGLSYLRLEKIWLALLLKLHLIERSADTALTLKRTLAPFQAKLALRQLQYLPATPLREFFLIQDREKCLQELRQNGCRLEEFWYETPVAPHRYYQSQNFPEKENPNAVFFAEHVVNLPTWYNKTSKRNQIAKARKIIEKYITK